MVETSSSATLHEELTAAAHALQARARLLRVL
jgi:hypothetical protein